MRIAIVPQLVPVAKEHTEAHANTRMGNQSGETISCSIAARKSPVMSLSQLAFNPQANNRMLNGVKLDFTPVHTAVPISATLILDSPAAQTSATKNPLAAATARTLTLSAFESASRHAVRERSEPVPPPSTQNPPSSKEKSVSNGSTAENGCVTAFGAGLDDEVSLRNWASGSATAPVSRARLSAFRIGP